MEGKCKFGSNCNFAHGEIELRGKSAGQGIAKVCFFIKTTFQKFSFHKKKNNFFCWLRGTGP